MAQTKIRKEQINAIREILQATRTYYVRTDGSDSNTGLANTAGGAFLTIQKAIDTVMGLDIQTYDVTIQVADGTYTGGTLINGAWLGSGTVSLVGNTGTPANVLISVTSTHCFNLLNNARISISGIKMQTTTSGFCIIAATGCAVSFVSVDFGACAIYHIVAQGGSFIGATGNYTISGGAGRHWSTDTGGYISVSGVTVTLTGTPNFTDSFANAAFVSTIICHGNTFSGSATGVRYGASINGVIFTNGGGANYLPGNAAGSTGSGGQYI